MEVIRHGKGGAGTAFERLGDSCLSLSFLLQAKISTLLPMGTTSEGHWETRGW